MARLPGVSRAAPTPCKARAAIRNGASGANPQSTEASANQTTPIRNTRRRPYLSPTAPANSSRPARVSVYAVTTHCSELRLVWKSRPITGSAMPTTVASIEAIAEPSTVASSTHRPRALLYRSSVSGLDVIAVSSSLPHLIPCPGALAAGRRTRAPYLLAPSFRQPWRAGRAAV